MDGKALDSRTVGRSVGFIGGTLMLGALVFLSVRPTVRRSDIHSEYVKFLSGRDTVTAYIAYPERPQPAPAVIVIHEILACRISSGRRPNSWRRMVSSPSRPTCCHVGAARPRHPTPRASLSQH